MGAATQPIFPKPNPILPWSRSPLAASAGVGCMFLLAMKVLFHLFQKKKKKTQSGICKISGRADVMIQPMMSRISCMSESYLFYFYFYFWHKKANAHCIKRINVQIHRATSPENPTHPH
jgi:hypothetical protein